MHEKKLSEQLIMQTSLPVCHQDDGINANELNGNDGFVIVGESENNVGWSVSYIGDINNDGIDDVALGVRSNPGNQEYVSVVNVIFGKNGTNFDPFVSASSSNGINGFTVYGLTFLGANFRVSSAGDMNGDGIADFVIGAPYAYTNGQRNTGAIYIVFGHSLIGASGNITLDHLNAGDGFKIYGEGENNYFGTDVRLLGDVNNDGIDDVAIDVLNLPQVYIIFGNQFLGINSSFTLRDMNGMNGFAVYGPSAAHYLGWLTIASSPGDVNGDGIADLLLGVRQIYTSIGADYPTLAYLLYGCSDVGSKGIVELEHIVDNKRGLEFRGDHVGLNIPAVSFVGDINGDGFDDIIVGDLLMRENLLINFVLFGGGLFANPNVLDLPELEQSEGVLLYRQVESDDVDVQISKIGDIDCDGVDDFVLGFPHVSSQNKENQVEKNGEILVIYGNKLSFADALDLGELSAPFGFKIQGETQEGLFGSAVSFAGDMNGDGIDDFMVGAPGEANKYGKSYIIFCFANESDKFVDTSRPDLDDQIPTIYPTFSSHYSYEGSNGLSAAIIGIIIAGGLLCCSCILLGLLLPYIAPGRRRLGFYVTSRGEKIILPDGFGREDDSIHLGQAHSHESTAGDSIHGQDVANACSNNICFNHHIIFDHLVIGKRLCESNRSEINTALYCNQTVVVKKFAEFGLTSSRSNTLAFELEILKEIKHKNIIQLYGITQPDSSLPMLVMEFCSSLSLYDYLHSDKTLTWGLRYRMAFELLSALAYLHEYSPQILHCRLKSTNVLLDKQQAVKLTDFGLSQLRQYTSTASSIDPAGETIGPYIRWMAPELFFRSTGVATMASDVYAVGMVLFELVTREIPYSNLIDPKEIKQKIKKGGGEQLPDDCQSNHPEFSALIKNCWLVKNNRPSATILKDQYKRLWEQSQFGRLVSSDNQVESLQSPPTLSPWSMAHV